MSDREEFENRLQVPEDALWSEKKQGYYWSNYPTVAHPFNEDWEVWQEALEYARAQSGQGAEPVARHHANVCYEDCLCEHGNGCKLEAEYGVHYQPAQQGSVPKGENDFGLDARYFHEKLRLILRDINSYTPTEMARALGRLAITANPETMREPEFSIRDLIDGPKYRDTAPQPQGDGWVRCKDKIPKLGQRVQLFAQGVIQPIMPMLDEDVEGRFWDFEVPEYNLPVDVQLDHQWRPMPQPPKEDSREN